jgi:hypothetical protein
MGWTQTTAETSIKPPVPFAVSIARPSDYSALTGAQVKAADIDLVARFYSAVGDIIMHTAAPGSGSTCLGAAASIPGTIPNRVLADSSLKSGMGGDLSFGHPGGKFTLHSEPNLDPDPNRIAYRTLSFPRTARIICDGTVYMKAAHRSARATWTEVDEVDAASFFLLGDSISVQR